MSDEVPKSIKFEESIPELPDEVWAAVARWDADFKAGNRPMLEIDRVNYGTSDNVKYFTAEEVNPFDEILRILGGQ